MIESMNPEPVTLYGGRKATEKLNVVIVRRGHHWPRPFLNSYLRRLDVAWEAWLLLIVWDKRDMRLLS